MLSIGLDYHFRLSVICILDSNGKAISTRTIHGTMDILLEELRKIKKSFKICFEASTGYGALYEGLLKIPKAKQVIVVHAGKVRLIFKSKRKTDRIDAKKLATLLFLDELPQVYVPCINIRTWRTMINHRNHLANDRQRVRNGIRAFLRHRAIKAPSRLWTKAGRQWLYNLEFPQPMDTIQRDCQLSRLENVNELIRRVEKELNRIISKHPGAQLLQTIPGVGPRTAEAIMAYIDTPKRFGRTRSIGDYFGVVPQLDASAGKYRYGHITKDGPSVVRKMITEAAWQGIQRSPALRKRFEQYMRKDKQRKRIAIVAVGHFMLRAMLAMLKHNKKWNPEMAVSQAG
jgi:transposase